MPREKINISLDILIPPVSADWENDTKVDILRVAGKIVACTYLQFFRCASIRVRCVQKMYSHTEKAWARFRSALKITLISYMLF